MLVKLRSRAEEPPFHFYVKSNTSSNDYYAYDTIEEAMERARVLSLTEYPVAFVAEVGMLGSEYYLYKIMTYTEGRSEVENDERMLHVMWYTEAGECLNTSGITEVL